MKRWLRKLTPERMLFFFAVLSLLPMLTYIPTPKNKARFLADEFADACAPFREGRLQEATHSIRFFLDHHPGSEHEGEGRMLLARTLLGLVPQQPERAGELLKSAAGLAQRAQQSGVDPEAARALRLEAADRLTAAEERDRAVEVYDALLAEDALPVDRLLVLARLDARLAPPQVDRALERIDRFLKRAEGDDEAQVRGLLVRSEIGQQTGRPEVAAAALQDAVARFPANQQAAAIRIELGRTLFLHGDRASVEIWLAPLLAPEVPAEARATAAYWCGRADLADGRIQRAIERFRAVLEAAPGAGLRFAADLFLASAFRQLRELRTAYAYLEDAVQEIGTSDPFASPFLDPAEFVAEVRWLSQLSQSRELLTFGSQLCAALARELPRGRRASFLLLHADATERLARRLQEDARAAAGRPDEAAALDARAIEALVEAAGSWLELVESHEPVLLPGRCAYQAALDLHEAGRLSEAIRAFRTYLAECSYEDPLQPHALYMLGACFRSLAMQEKALDAYSRCILQFPDAFPDAYLSRLETGICYEELGQADAAEAAYLEILEGRELDWRNPVWRRSLARLGEVYYRKLQRDLAAKDAAAADDALGKAIRRLEEYRRRYPEDHPEAAPVLRTLGACRLHARQWDEAMDALRRAVDLGRGDARPEISAATRGASLLLADALYLKGEVAAAFANYVDHRQRWGSGTTELWTLRQMANCQDRLGDPREAARYRELYGLALSRLGEGKDQGLPAAFWSGLVEEH